MSRFPRAVQKLEFGQDFIDNWRHLTYGICLENGFTLFSARIDGLNEHFVA